MVTGRLPSAWEGGMSSHFCCHSGCPVVVPWDTEWKSPMLLISLYKTLLQLGKGRV